MRERRPLWKGVLNRCRVLAAKIDDELCNKKSEHFVDKLVLADFCAALERAVLRHFE
jgi:hypothetical protein